MPSGRVKGRGLGAVFHSLATIRGFKARLTHLSGKGMLLLTTVFSPQADSFPLHLGFLPSETVSAFLAKAERVFLF